MMATVTSTACDTTMVLPMLVQGATMWVVGSKKFHWQKHWENTLMKKEAAKTINKKICDCWHSVQNKLT